MTTFEIRDPDQARRFLAQALRLQRVSVPSPALIRPALAWAAELAAAGEPIPPPGVVADLGHLLVERVGPSRTAHEATPIPGWSAGLARRYEDLVLGKFDADPTVARASDALARLKGRDRDRGVAFVLEQVRRRAGLGGVLLSPAALKSAVVASPEEVHALGWRSIADDGLAPALPALYEDLIARVREMHDLLGPEDLFELEHGTALAAFGQRVALRQVLQAAALLEADAPRDRPRRDPRRHDVATRLIEEDAYPVGGFSSISNKGSVESLLHSQLAYIEPDERPDLFDIKYARDELLYYARDENQFFRRRRVVVVVLDPDLAAARVKDRTLPFQRIVLALGLIQAFSARLTEWLSEEALTFEFLLVRDDAGPGETLADERGLLEMLHREAIAHGSTAVAPVRAAEVAGWCEARVRRGLCQVLSVSTADRPIDVPGALTARLSLAGPRPVLVLDDDDESGPGSAAEPEDDLATWRAAVARLLDAWA